MIFYRCSCGETKSYSSHGVPACRTCDSCGTTLSSHAEERQKPAPHDWKTVRTETTYQGQTTVKARTECVRCGRVLKT